MKRIPVTRIFALALLVVAAWFVSACQPHRTPEQRADWMVSKIAKELDLDEPQKTKLEAVKDAFLAARAQMRKEHDALFGEALALVQGTTLDQGKVIQLLDRHQALQRQAAPVVVAKLAEFHASLTAEQRTKAAEHLKRLHDRMHGHD